MLILWGLLAAFTTTGTNAQVATGNHRVSIVLSDCWGNPIASARIVVQAEMRGQQLSFLAYPSDKDLQLGPGTYLVSIDAKGMFPLVAHFSVGEHKSEYRTCLTLAPIGGVRQSYSDLTVVLSRSETIAKKKYWVRLTSLFSEFNSTASADSGGAFVFPQLRSGKYLALLMAEDEIEGQKLVELRGQKETIAIP